MDNALRIQALYAQVSSQESLSALTKYRSLCMNTPEHFTCLTGTQQNVDIKDTICYDDIIKDRYLTTS